MKQTEILFHVSNFAAHVSGVSNLPAGVRSDCLLFADNIKMHAGADSFGDICDRQADVGRRYDSGS